MDDPLQYLERRGARRDLLILVHGLQNPLGAPRGGPMATVAEAVREDPDVDVLRPMLPFRPQDSADPTDVVAGLVRAVDTAWADRVAAHGDGYTAIKLVGISLGGLFARKLYVVGCGEHPDAPLEDGLKERLGGLEAARPWASRVERIVLLAALNRGWTVNHHLSLRNAAGFRLGLALLWPLRKLGGERTIMHCRRGSEFVTALRIQWIRMQQRAKATGRPGGALTVQLLGTRDDLVSPDDNLDIVAGQNFVYLEVPGTGHLEAGDMTDAGRRRCFALALTGERADLEDQQVIPYDEEAIRPVRHDVTHVVFVIHGIRDVGYWTHKIARRVKLRARRLDEEELAPAAPARREGCSHSGRRVVVSETSTYGYFPMLPFLLSWRRRAKVEWLTDEYAQNVATYPCATFSYVGHSNGTYLLARALRDHPWCRFDRVVFAGSVVGRKYEWNTIIKDRKQVGRVLNFVATGDWVVAFFPKAFEVLRLSDLGAAGHDGFDPEFAGDGVEQRTFVAGGHSAALEERYWDAIAAFVLGEDAPLPVPVEQRRKWWVEYPGRFAPAVIAGLGALLAAPLRLITRLPWSPGRRAVAGAGYVAAVWRVLTRL